MKEALTKGISTPVIQLLVALALAGLVWLAMSPALLDDMTPGEFVAFITAASLMAKPVRQLTDVNSVDPEGHRRLRRAVRTDRGAGRTRQGRPSRAV